MPGYTVTRPRTTPSQVAEIIYRRLVPHKAFDRHSTLGMRLVSISEEVLEKITMPVLDDWDENFPEGWDYESVLTEWDVTVHHEETGWYLVWTHGVIGLGENTEPNARKLSALFVSLWIRAVSASFADKLVTGFAFYLDLCDGFRNEKKLDFKFRQSDLVCIEWIDCCNEKQYHIGWIKSRNGEFIELTRGVWEVGQPTEHCDVIVIPIEEGKPPKITWLYPPTVEHKLDLEHTSGETR
jgi:hypothetical protein